MSIRDKRLYIETIGVGFDGLKTLKELSLQVNPGELRHNRPGRRG